MKTQILNWCYNHRPFKKVYEVEFLIFLISLLLGMVSLVFTVISIRGLIFHSGSPLILDCAIRGAMTLGAFIIIRVFNHQWKPTFDQIRRWENEKK
jgi:hypothetical protein